MRTFFLTLFNGILLLLLTSTPSISRGIENGIENMTNSFSFKNTPFNEVIAALSYQYNVEIFYDEALSKNSISGEYLNLSLDDILNRLLKDKNFSILTYSKNRIIYIRSFGVKNQHLVALSSSQTGKKSINSRDPFTQKSITELNAILEQQENNKKARLNNPNYIDPFSGESQANLKRIKQLQEIRKQQRTEDPKFIDPMTGKTYLDLVLIKQEQEEKKTQRLNNPNYIDPLTGMTMSTLNNILRKQEENKKARLGL